MELLTTSMSVLPFDPLPFLQLPQIMLPVIARSCRPNLVLQASRALAVVGHAAHALSAHL